MEVSKVALWIEILEGLRLEPLGELLESEHVQRRIVELVINPV